MIIQLHSSNGSTSSLAPFTGSTVSQRTTWHQTPSFFAQLDDPDGGQVVYWKRCCSMYEYYVMLSKDNPQYKDKWTKEEKKKREAKPS
jgi:hypothetical protein